MIAEAIAPPSDALAGLADLAEDIDRLQSEDLRRTPASELGPRLKALRRAINRLEAEAARTLEQFDRGQSYTLDGALSAAAWLRYHCNVSYGAASDQVQLARRLPELPRAARAFAAGELGPAHASLMARTADQVGVAPVQEQEEGRSGCSPPAGRSRARPLASTRSIPGSARCGRPPTPMRWSAAPPASDSASPTGRWLATRTRDRPGLLGG